MWEQNCTGAREISEVLEAGAGFVINWAELWAKYSRLVYPLLAWLETR
jgi:hypothetical protein